MVDAKRDRIVVGTGSGVLALSASDLSIVVPYKETTHVESPWLDRSRDRIYAVNPGRLVVLDAQSLEELDFGTPPFTGNGDTSVVAY